jgi:hypothetical protein
MGEMGSRTTVNAKQSRMYAKNNHTVFLVFKVMFLTQKRAVQEKPITGLTPSCLFSITRSIN